ncbi:MAG TPA: hypothetical protein DCG47_14650 [Spirochaetaceae bacterium]|nr:hypothetical protein [Spirochaetaceae bacterium]
MKHFLARLGALTKGPVGSILAALAIAALIIVFSLTPAYRSVEYVLYDLRFRLKPKAEPLPELVLLNVDDPSIAALDVYPWPRYYYAEALRQLEAVGLGGLVCDLQFIESSPALVNMAGFEALALASAAGAVPGPEELASLIIDNDGELSAAAGAYGRAVMPFSFANVSVLPSLSDDELAYRSAAVAEFTRKASLPIPMGQEEAFEALKDSDRVAVNYPIPGIMLAVDYFGFVDNDVDEDGTHRRVRLARVFDDRVYFQLGFVSFLRMCGVGLEAVIVEPGKQMTIRDAVHPVSGKRGDIVIPVDKRCSVYFDWIGDFNATARSLSAHALFEYAENAELAEFQLMLKDMESGQSLRMELAEELAAIKQSMAAERDLERRFPLKKAYWSKLAAYQAVIQGYLDESAARLDELRADKAAGTEVDEAEISSLMQLITAIRIKTEVDYLYDSVAVIGLTATGTQDIGVTPLSSAYWMVGSYPTIINTLARGRFLRDLPKPAEYALIALLAVAIVLSIRRLPAKPSIALIVIAVLGVNAAIILAFFQSYIIVGQFSLNLALVFPSTLVMLGKFAGEEENRQFIQGAFSKYLAQDVIDQILANPDSLRLGGQSCEITTFFSDVAGFSSISEKLSAEDLVQLLNEYLSEMSDIIMHNRGTVDKYEGDAIMAFWGAPLSYPEHPYNACLSAVQMQARLEELRAAWRAQGRDELKVRIGLNTGKAVAGNMGSHTRMNYTVMGDSVNLASRLEGANKFYGSYTMASEYTWQATKDDFRYRELDIIRVVGKAEPIRVFELIGLKGGLSDAREAVLASFDSGLALYRQRRWKEALNAFTAALRVDMADGPSRVYYARCRKFLSSPPAADWDGVSSLSSK